VDLAGFVKAADAGKAPPVTLLHGAEPFLLDDAVGRLGRAMFSGQSELSLVREVLDARAAGADGIVQSALILPWLGDRRLVVARGVEGLPAKSGESLAAYVKAPNPSTVLVLLAETLLEPSHWLLRAVPAAAVVAAPTLTGRALAGWLRGHAQASGYALDEEAAGLLVELSGDDLTQLVGEVEKAALAGGPENRRVTAAEVRAVVGEHRLRHVFDLTRALIARDTAAALTLLEALLNSGEEPLAVLGMLSREARAIWQAAWALGAGRAPEEIARSLRRPPAAATALLERAKTLSPGTAARQLARCWEVERRLKLGGAARPELSLLVADLCRA
jgi:DNA polymerase III subunit delta